MQGAQQALSLIARVVLNEGETAVVEDPHYQLGLQALHAHGAHVHAVRTDAQGIVTAELPARGARLLYATPAHQFPSGAVLSPMRRVELLQWAARHDCWIVEDDYDSEFSYGGAALPTLRSLDMRERVIYVGSFSKSMNPSVRLGYIVSPAHLRRASRELQGRRDALLDGLRRHARKHIEVADSQAGMHVVGWFRALTYRQCDTLIRDAAERGLGLHPIHSFYMKPPLRPGLLLGFAGLSPTQIRAATRLLGRCLAEL